MNKEPKDAVIITHSGDPDGIMMPMLKNNDVHYFDHHEIEVERRNLLRDKCKTFVSKNEELCTAKLIVEHYKFEETDHEVLSDCAQTTDYYGSKGRELTKLGTELAKAISTESDLAWENIVQTVREGLHDHKIWRNDYILTGELAKGAAMTQMAMDAEMSQFTDSAPCHELFENTNSITIAAITISDNRLNILSGMFGDT